MIDKIADGIVSGYERDPSLVAADKLLDTHFSATYNIVHTRAVLRLSGIDRLFTAKASGHRFTVDYIHALEGHTNCFVELHVGADVHGWLYTNLNQVSAFYNSHVSKVALVDFMRLKREVVESLKKKEYSLKNYSYNGILRAGIFIPFGVIGSWGKVFEVKND